MNSSTPDIKIKHLDQRRFEALAGYTRLPWVTQLVQEFDWISTEDERLLGVLTWDRTDHDFGWLILGRDERLRFRAVAVNCSLPTADAAMREVQDRLLLWAAKSDTAFHQGDSKGAAVDFFTPLVMDDRLHPTFRILTTQRRYSPARELAGAMMRYYDDVDGNFIEQFQTTAFDARLWELYLFATFTELGYARNPDVTVPDLMLTGIMGSIGIEATTANPPNSPTDISLPQTKDELGIYLENYIPIKLGRALKRKLNRRDRYWTHPHMADVPFILAIQDFHAPGIMRVITTAATGYVFGVRHSIVNGARRIEWIKEHRYGSAVETSGFFNLPNAENVSAVIVNPQGTLTKFNRLGYIAGFGDRRVRMTRSGLRRGELDPDGPFPKPFVHVVHEPGYEELWVEGMVVLHNPHARVPLNPMLIPGAAHEFLRPDGSIGSLLPEFHPFLSETAVTIDDSP